MKKGELGSIKSIWDEHTGVAIKKVDRARARVVAVSFVTHEREEPTVTFHQKYINKNLENSIRLPKDTIKVFFCF